MKSSSLLVRSLATALLFVSFASCSENLDSSGVCSVLCPPVGGNVQNITLDAVVFDTTVQSLSGLGTESGLFLASRGDTLDTRVIIRYDSLPLTFSPKADTARPITSVDSAFLLLHIDTLSIKGPGPVTIEAYDVDTTASDTSTAAVLALFRPDRFISSRVLTRVDLKDTVRYYISNAAVLAKIQSKGPFRIGLRATGSSSSQMRIISTEGGRPPTLSFRATPDTATAALVLAPFSRTPVGQAIIAFHLSDYTAIAKGPPPGSPSNLDVGGLPPRRVYVQFNIPLSIIDSATVVRATLLLNQIPNALLDPTDTVLILPSLVLAGKAVTDPTKAAQIVADIALDTLKVMPGGSGLREIELARAFPIWRTQSPDTVPRAIVLKTLDEGNSPLEIRFSSSEEVVALLRPRLRISYTSRVPLGIP
ncbi:MAG TPA: hypothetical protein VGQ98_08530 [Gemmatimonadaceae bacterium]|nr:hypothetical protein [Gemmatimonadaceae bacterium]